MWTEFCQFLTPPPLRGQFLYPEHEQKQTFVDPLPKFFIMSTEFDKNISD